MPTLTWCRVNQPSLVSRTNWMLSRGGHNARWCRSFPDDGFPESRRSGQCRRRKWIRGSSSSRTTPDRLRKNKNHGVGVLDVRAEHHAGLLLARGERLLGVQRFRRRDKSSSSAVSAAPAWAANRQRTAAGRHSANVCSRPAARRPTAAREVLSVSQNQLA